MKYVRILSTKNDGSQSEIARCALVGQRVECTGDEDLVRYLSQKGISSSGADRKQLFPADGVAFLEQLQFTFKSGYTNATDVLDDGLDE